MLIKCDDFSSLVMNRFNNKSFNLDYKELFKCNEFKNVSCVYIDTPYTGEQYSRFYHILETVAKYDNPKLEFKAKYRTDRFMSNFSLRSTVKQEFRTSYALVRYIAARPFAKSVSSSIDSQASESVFKVIMERIKEFFYS